MIKERKILINTKIPQGDIRLVEYKTNDLVGIYSRDEAIVMADSQGLDLICKKIADMPICFTGEIGRFLFQEKRREKDKKRNIQKSKDITMGPKMQRNDFIRVIQRGLKFLEKFHQVTYTVRLRRYIRRREDRPQIIRRCNYMIKKISEITESSSIAKVCNKQFIKEGELHGYIHLVPITKNRSKNFKLDQYTENLQSIIEIPGYVSGDKNE